MLTPVEIQSKTFKSGGLGYDKKDVDHFMREVLNSYENMYRENMELNDKIATLTEAVQYYKTIEKTLQKALVLAEKTAEDTKAAAIKNAKNIESEASIRAQVIIADAKNELEHVHAQTIKIAQQYEKYKAQFKSLAAAQIDLLESDSFDINIANLEAFIPVNSAKNVKEQDEDNLTSASGKYYSESSGNQILKQNTYENDNSDLYGNTDYTADGNYEGSNGVYNDAGFGQYANTDGYTDGGGTEEPIIDEEFSQDNAAGIDFINIEE